MNGIAPVVEEASWPAFDESHPLLVFDGVCVLCSAWFRFILEHDTAQRFRFALAQSPLGQSLYRHYGLDPVDFRTNLVIAGGRLHTEMDACAAVMAQLPLPWLALSIAGIVPKRLGDPLYLLVARNRYRWFGRTERCMVSTQALKSRFAPGGWV